MRYYSLIAFACILFFGCRSNNDYSGLWRMRKVEILRNNELNKVIDTCDQYWRFGRMCVIEIFDRNRKQNTLHVRFNGHSIQSFDSSGGLQDEFVVERMGKGNLALTSSKRLLNDSIDVVYFLDRVTSPAAGLK